jgi:AraC-like DNA-binding protein
VQFASARETPLVGRASPAVRRWLVDGYTGYDEGMAPHRLVVPASAAVPLVIKLVDTPHRPPAFTMGAHDTYAVMDGACAPAYVEARLPPLAAYTVLGLPLTELGGQIVDLADVFGPETDALVDRLRAQPSWPGRFAVLDGFLARLIARGPEPAPEVAYAWRRIRATGGAVRIGRLVEDVGCSHRHLIAMFRRHIGLTPRTAARLVRFEGILRRLDRRAPIRWEQAAADLGYADQAHLIKDFKHFTGTTPAVYPAVKSVQDGAPVPA